MSFTPPRPVGAGGDNEAAIWCQWVHDRLTGKIPLFVSTPKTEWQINSDGTYSLRVRQGPATGEAPPAGGMTYKGEWAVDSVCAAQEMWTRGVLGEFICVAAPPIGTAPETGAPYWHALQNVPPGQWA
jgi:hypothetical protein